MSDDKGSNALLSVAKEFLGPAAKELGNLAVDHIRYYRWKSAVSIIRRATEWADARGIARRSIPLKFIVPFIERCSLEEEDSEMANRWSELLINASNDYNEKYEVYSRFLSEITSQEAGILKKMWQSIKEMEIFHFDKYSDYFCTLPNDIDYNEFPNTEESLEKIDLSRPGAYTYIFRGNDVPNTNELILNGFDIGIELMHLESLRLVRNRSGVFLAKGERCFVFQSQLTPFGYDFVSACEAKSD